MQYQDSALSAGQLAIMAVVVVAALAAWLILVFLAAREPRGTSAAVNAGRRDEGTAATVTQLAPGGRRRRARDARRDRPAAAGPAVRGRRPARLRKAGRADGNRRHLRTHRRDHHPGTAEGLKGWDT